MGSSARKVCNKPPAFASVWTFWSIDFSFFPHPFLLSPLFVSPYLFQQFCSGEINGPPICWCCACHLSDTFARSCARCCLNKRAGVYCVCMCVFAFVSSERVILWRVGPGRADKLFAKTNN